MAQYCSSCGSANPDNARYCWSDGQILDQSKASSSIIPSRIEWDPQPQFHNVTPNSGSVTQEMVIQNNGPGGLEGSLSIDNPSLLTVTPAYINENVSYLSISLNTNGLQWGTAYDTNIRLDMPSLTQEIVIPVKVQTHQNELVVEDFGKMAKIAEVVALTIGFVASWLVSGRIATEFLIVLFTCPTLALMLTAFDTLPWDRGYEISWQNIVFGFVLTAGVSIILAIIESIDNYTADALGTIFMLCGLMVVVTNIAARLLQGHIVDYLTKQGINVQTRVSTLLKLSLTPFAVSIVLIILPFGSANTASATAGADSASVDFSPFPEGAAIERNIVSWSAEGNWDRNPPYESSLRLLAPGAMLKVTISFDRTPANAILRIQHLSSHYSDCPNGGYSPVTIEIQSSAGNSTVVRNYAPPARDFTTDSWDVSGRIGERTVIRITAGDLCTHYWIQSLEVEFQS